MTLVVPGEKNIFQALVGNLFQPWLEIAISYRLGMGPWSGIGESTFVKQRIATSKCFKNARWITFGKYHSNSRLYN